jgi:hypothetical protein
MENLKAMLIPNTEAENLSVENFYDFQNEVRSPMLLFMDKESNVVIKHYRIAANTMDKLKTMFDHKYFDTLDLPEGQCEKFGGGYLVGVKSEEIAI